MSKKDKAFALFDEGKTSSSPDVKALGLKGTTKYNYYADWQKSKGVTSPSQGAISEAKGKGKAISELEMVVPSEEKELGEGKVKEGQETGEGKAGEEVEGKIPRTVLENQGENQSEKWEVRTIMAKKTQLKWTELQGEIAALAGLENYHLWYY